MAYYDDDGSGEIDFRKFCARVRCARAATAAPLVVARRSRHMVRIVQQNRRVEQVGIQNKVP
jgi:hypothetical protein